MTIAERMTFMSGSLARTPFRHQVAAAAAAGFDSVTIWPNVWRHAQRRDGLSLADMRAMLDHHGLVLTDADPCMDWVPPASSADAVRGPLRTRTPRAEFFEVCAALGGTTIVATHMTDAPLEADRDIEAFARLCDDAGEHGLRIALEFVPFSNVVDVTTAWHIVSQAGRPNGGLVVDLWHHVRGGGDDAALAAVPAERIYTVQLSDGPALAPADLADEAMYHRLLPGQGAMDLARLVRLLERSGVRASVGPELYATGFEDRPPAEVARELYDATRRLLGVGSQ